MLNNWMNKAFTRKEGLDSKKALNHFILNTNIKDPVQDNEEEIFFGCGCFWGAEKCFWKLPGVKSTAVGYAGGSMENPTYRQVCTGRTDHAEVVRVTWITNKIDTSDLLKMFWECHDPTQGNRQGNDTGSQYRSAIYTTNSNQTNLVLSSKVAYQDLLNSNGLGEITTEISENVKFYFAEDYHQQYLAKPGSRPYCSAMPTTLSLGDFEGSKYKLSKEVWLNYNWKVNHCVLRSTNEPIQIKNL